MNISDVKINEKEWNKFKPYIENSEEYAMKLSISILLFDLDREKYTFEDILRLIKMYKNELDKFNRIYWVDNHCIEISNLDPIFFYDYYKNNYYAELPSSLNQSNCGAIYYCENFISELYEKMEKDSFLRGSQR